MTTVSKGGAAEKQQQRMQKKPGRSGSDRTLGNIDELIHRRLKTIEPTNQLESEDVADKQESDLYEHIKDAQSQHDAQTFDAATAEQQKEQPVPNLKDDQAAEELTDQDVDMKPDDSKPATVCYEICKSLHSRKSFVLGELSFARMPSRQYCLRMNKVHC